MAPSLRSFFDEASVRTFLDGPAPPSPAFSLFDHAKPHPAGSIFDAIRHFDPFHELVKRINITINVNSSAALVAASRQDPWIYAGKYSLGWVYFCILLLVASIGLRIYHLWTDKIRRALYKEDVAKTSQTSSPDTDYEMANLGTNNSDNRLFPRDLPRTAEPDTESSLSIPLVHKVLALFRWLIYRPIPPIRLGKKAVVVFPSASVTGLVFAASAFALLYCFVPQPLFYDSIRYGSPPLAIRAGMIAVAMVPWIVALSMKANLVTLITGIGHERLGPLHKWGGYICLALALVHTVPFYITPVWDQGALQVFQNYFVGQYYVYGTGIAALTPLVFLVVHSFPLVRSRAYELFVVLHTPAAVVFVGMMFWHCNNYLTSWSYLWATVAIWLISLVYRLCYLNWVKWWRLSWLCGEEAAITILPENAVKVTIPTQVKWRPGQFVYLRIPGISFFENHPFTIASLCSEEFTSEYGEQYRDMVIVFRPFGGFTRKVVDAARKNGPYHTYRAFIDGPYGGMQRELTSFDTVVLVAGGSGITAIVSQLLLLIKKMRDGTAVTKRVHVVWALKRPETAEWFREELRICRQFAPPESVHCQFFITAAKRQECQAADLHFSPAAPRPVSYLHDRVNDVFQGIASKRNSALIQEAAGGDAEREKEPKQETEDSIVALPQVHLPPPRRQQQPPQQQQLYNPAARGLVPGPPSLPPPPPYPPGGLRSHAYVPPPKQADALPQKTPLPSEQQPPPHHPIQPDHKRPPTMKIAIPPRTAAQTFDFGFPSTPTVFQKSLMRFAFLPSTTTNAGTGAKRSGWHTEYGRPDLPFMLRELEPEFGRRTAIFVCGPPTMRTDVKSVVAGMQRGVLAGKRDEVFLWGEDYAL